MQNSNENIVLVPGLLCTEQLWQYQIGELSKVANIFHANIYEDDSLEKMAAKTLQDAPDAFILAGLSMGGYVALEIWRQAPHRVKKLILINTTARPVPQE